ncbi:MAG: ParA family protein [Sporomusaceae bacterium]|jgi:chromosome partitioning protein|nr:ParA family protein [Sporomusaceae bacterium]
MSKVYAIANQKGGCGKTSLTLNLGACLARMGYRVCLCDCDPQANMTMALGYPQPDELPITLPHIMQEIISVGFKPEKSSLLKKRKYILNAQRMDFIPSSIELTGIENILINTMSRENVLKKFINHIKGEYNFILLDCMPSLNFVTINALNAADRVLIPMQPQYFSAKGLELLLGTIANVKENLNPDLTIEGALVTMYDKRLNFHRNVLNTVTDAYGKYFQIFETKIPVSVRVTETQASGQSIFEHDPKGRVAEAYSLFAKELTENE